MRYRIDIDMDDGRQLALQSTVYRSFQLFVFLNAFTVGSHRLRYKVEADFS